MKKYIILLLAVTTIFAKKDAEIVIPDNISISDDKKEVIGTYEVDLKSDITNCQSIDNIQYNFLDLFLLQLCQKTSLLIYLETYMFIGIC